MQGIKRGPMKVSLTISYAISRIPYNNKPIAPINITPNTAKMINNTVSIKNLQSKNIIKNKKVRQPKLTHRKTQTPIVATQFNITFTTKVCQNRACVFTESKKTHTSHSEYIKLCSKSIIPHPSHFVNPLKHKSTLGSRRGCPHIRSYLRY